MLTFIALIGWMYMVTFILKYLVARYVYKMTPVDLSYAMQEDGVFFIIKSSLDK